MTGTMEKTRAKAEALARMGVIESSEVEDWILAHAPDAPPTGLDGIEVRAKQMCGFVRSRIGWDWADGFDPNAEEWVIVSAAKWAAYQESMDRYNALLELDVDWRMAQPGQLLDKMIAPNTGEGISVSYGGGPITRRTEYAPGQFGNVGFYPTENYKPDWEDCIVWGTGQ